MPQSKFLPLSVEYLGIVNANREMPYAESRINPMTNTKYCNFKKQKLGKKILKTCHLLKRNGVFK